MKIWRPFSNQEQNHKPLVLAIGNFDGVHLGHRAIIEKARLIAFQKQMALGVMTFEPHPKTFFNPDLKNFRLTPQDLKSQILSSLGVDYLYVVDFNESFLKVSAEDFIKSWLIDSLKTKHIVVGYDFVFGNNGEGCTDTLIECSRKGAFKVTVIPKVCSPSGEEYSSTAVRAALADGNLLKANAFLGAFFKISGRVKLGRRMGKKLGFPTANLEIGDFCQPKKGVYAVLADVTINNQPKRFKGVANIGGSPTFKIDNYFIEAHLFDFSGNLYKKKLTISLVESIRETIKFKHIDDLKQQIKLDEQKARVILADYKTY